MRRHSGGKVIGPITSQAPRQVSPTQALWLSAPRSPPQSQTHTRISCGGHGPGRGTPTPLPLPSTHLNDNHPGLGTNEVSWKCQSLLHGWGSALGTFRAYFCTGIKLRGSSRMPTRAKGNTLCSVRRSLQMALGGCRGCQQDQEAGLWVLESSLLGPGTEERKIVPRVQVRLLQPRPPSHSQPSASHFLDEKSEAQRGGVSSDQITPKNAVECPPAPTRPLPACALVPLAARLSPVSFRALESPTLPALGLGLGPSGCSSSRFPALSSSQSFLPCPCPQPGPPRPAFSPTPASPAVWPILCQSSTSATVWKLLGADLAPVRFTANLPAAPRE